jgi:hypothetical protein
MTAAMMAMTTTAATTPAMMGVLLLDDCGSFIGSLVADGVETVIGLVFPNSAEKVDVNGIVAVVEMCVIYLEVVEFAAEELDDGLVLSPAELTDVISVSMGEVISEESGNVVVAGTDGGGQLVFV